MNRHVMFVLITGLIVAVLLLGVRALPSLGFPGGPFGPAADPTPIHVNGSYKGDVALEGAYPGTLNDVATPQPLDLGSIELALALSQSDDDVTGYVVLSDTLVFTREHMITVTPVGPPPGPGTPAPTPHELDVGPQVQGSFDGATLQLQSEQFVAVVSGRRVTRQFSLVSSGIWDNGATVEGEYRETLWGYAPEPSTLVGTFSLHRPVFPSAGFDNDSYLPLIVRESN